MEADSTVQDLSDEIINLEKEIYQTLSDVITLTNKIFEEENSDRIVGGIVIELSKAVELLSPSNHIFRISAATDFSFAVCDMMSEKPLFLQVLLETNTLNLRLKKIKNALLNTRSYLLDEVDIYDEPFN